MKIVLKKFSFVHFHLMLVEDKQDTHVTHTLKINILYKKAAHTLYKKTFVHF